MLKRIVIGAVAVVLILGLGAASFVACARAGWLTPGPAAMRAKYALANSRFMTIDGEPIHYVDEGSGAPIVLIHGSLGSLRMWRDWAEILSARYRVIRFDRPPMGLSGPDPAGRYDAGREAEIIGKLTARLGVKRFFLVATSSGGESGAAYAAAHPEQIRGLILSNIAAGPLKIARGPYPPMFRLALAVDPWFKGWHPPALWRGVLEANFADPAKVSPALVAEWTDLNNRAQFMPRRPPPPGYVPFGHTPDDLAHITAPTLLLWSANDPEVPLKTVGQTAYALLGSRDKTIVSVPHCGHMMPIECGGESGRQALAFFDRISALGP